MQGGTTPTAQCRCFCGAFGVQLKSEEYAGSRFELGPLRFREWLVPGYSGLRRNGSGAAGTPELFYRRPLRHWNQATLCWRCCHNVESATAHVSHTSACNRFGCSVTLKGLTTSQDSNRICLFPVPSWKRAPIHSSRSRIKGSTDSARCAGIHVASSPSNNIARTTPANTSGSRGVA